MASNMAEPRCVVCATVCTGLESIAVKECKEKLNCKLIREGRGRVYCDIPATSINELKGLRSVEHLFVVVKEFENSEELDCHSPEILEKLYNLPQSLHWNLALDLWRQYTGYDGVILKTVVSDGFVVNNTFNDSVSNTTDLHEEGNKRELQSDNDTNAGDGEAVLKRSKHCNENVSNEEAIPTSLLGANGGERSESSLPRFRVTCTRNGTGHNFSSPEAAAKFGGGINDWFDWKVDLSNPDIEVLLNIVDNNVVVGIALTKESRGKRNIGHFGPTTLKSSIAYCMLQLANIEPGDVVCDPMCGGGSIPIEGALNWPVTLFLCGDNHDLAPPRTLANVQHVTEQQLGRKPLPLDIYQWDVSSLPLKSDSVNVIISDLPFGKKSGSKHENWQLYPKALTEMARVCPARCGRAVLLTHDKRVMSQVLNRSEHWKKELTLWVNMGGLKAGIYVLKRTNK